MIYLFYIIVLSFEVCPCDILHCVQVYDFMFLYFIMQ